MTVMPSALPAASPASGQASSADGTAGSGGAAGFLEMLLAALPTGDQPAPATGQAADEALGELPADVALLDGAAATVETDGATDEVVPEAEQTDVDPAQQLPFMLAPMQIVVSEAVRLQTAPTAPVAQDDATTAVVTGVGDASDGDAQVGTGTTPVAAPTTAGTDVDAGTQAEADSDDPTARTTAPATAPARTEAAATEQRPGAAVEQTGTTVATERTVAATAAPVARTADAAPAAAGIDVSSMTPVSGTAAATPTGPAASTAPATGPAAPAPVAAQVFPEVSRLVTRGDGTHRLTLTLTPEALGDVRITLTVRQGEVHVSFAAGDEAQRALLESAPELRRLLELTGATESRITVRDASGAGTSTGSNAGSGTGSQQGAGQADPGTSGGQDPTGTRRDPQDHHARTRDGQNAMDGDHRGVGATRRPHDPGTSTRSAGLDVTV